MQIINTSSSSNGDPVSVSPIRTDICPTGVFKNNETHSRSTSTHGYSSSHLSRRPSSAAPIKGGADTVDSFDSPAAQGSGSGDQSKEIQTDSTSEYGLPGGHSKSTADFPSREIEDNTAISPTPPSPTKAFGERPCEVCREDLSFNPRYRPQR